MVEVGFYLVLPLVGLGIWTITKGRLRPGQALVIIIGFGFIDPIWTVLSHQGKLLLVVSRLWPMAYFDWLAIGMLLAYGRKVGWHANLTASWLIAPVLSAPSTTAHVGPATLVSDDVNQALWRTTLYGLFAGAFVAPIALGIEAWWLRHPAMIWLGEVSCEFFLVRVLVMGWVTKVMGHQTFQGSMLAVAIVTTVIILPLSWLLRCITDMLTRRPGSASPWAAY